MQNYKIAVSKDGKKYTIVFKAETEKLARERVHKEGYSILSIEKSEDNINIKNIFIFTGYNKNGELKHGKIVGDDIFKTYVKLRKDLEYDVRELYTESDSNINKEEKEKIIFDLKEEYNLFFTGKRKLKIDELRDKIKKDKEGNKQEDNFYLKKELDETYKTIEFVLKKIENLLSGKSGIELNLEQKEKLKKIFNIIIKLKKTTNLSKLKEIGELALIKIGKIEIYSLEHKQNEKTKQLLKQTNILLKKFGSKESFIEKDKDIKHIINKFFENISNNITDLLQKDEDNKEKLNKNIESKTDKDSHSYIKNILFLRRYKKKLKSSNKFFFNNIFLILTNKEERSNFLIRRRVIKQNIILFKAKEKGVGFSYTFTKKGIKKIVEYILGFFLTIKKYLFAIIIGYTVLFIIFLNINYYYNIKEFSYEGIFYFIILYFIYLILHFTKNLFLIFFNFVILFFIIIFGVVNF